MAGKPQINTRVDESLFEEFEEYREDRDITKSEAGRRLIVDGLNAQDREATKEELEAIREEVRELRTDGGGPAASQSALEDTRQQVQSDVEDVRQQVETVTQRSNAWFLSVTAAALYVAVAQASFVPTALIQSLGILVVITLIGSGIYAYRGDSE